VAAGVLSDAELAQLDSWPAEVATSDLAAYFTLSVEDLRWLRSFRSTAAVRLGLAVQCCALGFLGFVPADVAAAPAEVTARLAKQVGVSPAALIRYGAETAERSRREHVEMVVAHTGWRTCGRGEWKALDDWLVARAIEHDTPSVLFAQALEHLRAERIVRPGLDRLVRAVATARVGADDETHRRLLPALAGFADEALDALLVTDPTRGVAPLVWLGDRATAASPEQVKAEVAKLAYLRGLGADRLDLSAVPPERRRHLATLARRSTPAALGRMAPERRHSILLAALAAAHTDIVDEMVQLFDQALSGTDSRARHQVAERRLAAAGADVERLVLLDDILEVVLDDDLDDTAAGSAVRGLGADRLAGARRSDEERLPSDGGHLELVEASYSHVRSFAPQVLGALTFEASGAPSEVLEAVVLLQAMNADGRRHVPDDTPTGFVPARWQPYLDAATAAGDANRYKHYWELCVLFALRGGLRSGEIWVHDSRRYADPASYLIAPAAWPSQRDDVLALAGMPATFAERLAVLDAETAGYLDTLEALLADTDSPVHLDDAGGLHLSPLAAEDHDPALAAERDALVARIPTVPLTEILIDVDRDTNFTAALTHAGGATPGWRPSSTAATSTPPSSPKPATTGPPAWPSSPASEPTPSTGPPAGTCEKTPSGLPTPPSSTRTTATPSPPSGVAAPCHPPMGCACPCEGGP